MKKLFRVLFLLLCSAALAMPVFADVTMDPVTEIVTSDYLPYVLIGVGVLAAGFVLFKLLRKKDD